MLTGTQVVFNNQTMAWREEEIIFINPKYIIAVEDYNMAPFEDSKNKIFNHFWGYKITTTEKTYFITVEDREKTYNYLKNYTPDRG